MPRWIKNSLKIVGALVVLIILLWIGVSVYITANKKTVLNSVLTQLNENINGKLSIGNMEPELLRGFPGVSIALTNVLLRDSLWEEHHRDLLKAEKIQVTLNVFSLITGKPQINRIVISNASVNLFTDTSGYSNTHVFKTVQKKEKSENKEPGIEIKNIDFSKVHFVVDNLSRKKRFDFDVDQLRGNIKYPLSGFYGSIKLKTQVKSFSFNTERGSFLKDKMLDGTLLFRYSKGDGIVVIEPNKLKIGKDPFIIGAKIHLKNAAFSIDITANKIMFHDIAVLLAPNISSKLLKFKIDAPIDVKGTIVEDGSGKYRDPLIKVTMKVRNSGVTIPSGKLLNTNFDGSFTNQHLPGKGIGDENSIIKFLKLTANYYNVPITVDTFMVNNLSRPIATGRVKAKFPLQNLNSSVGKQTFNFKSGAASVDLYCKADIENLMFTKPVIYGNIHINDADIVYLPGNVRLIKSKLQLNFTDTDLNLKNSHFQLGNSILNVNCSINNFLNLYYTAPEKILVNLNITSPQLYLNEFLPILGSRTTTNKPRKAGNAVKEFSEQMSTVLATSSMKIHLKVDKAVYKKLQTKNLEANIDLAGNEVFLRKASISHAGGSLNLSGNLKRLGSRNKFDLDAKISRVNVQEFFHGFDNFGQNSITDKNLRGYLSSTIGISGTLTNSGTLVPKSISGKVVFNLKDAVLQNFEPMLKAGKFAFANRDFSNIRMSDLAGTLDIAGEKIRIHPMQISSSVLNMDVKGVYSLGKGTEIAMDIPLRNPKGDELLDKAEREKVRMRGIVLHLKALDGDDGKVKIRWNRDR